MAFNFDAVGVQICECQATGWVYIQRIDTIGGIAPVASECTADSIGNIARVDYTVTYAFFERDLSHPR